MALLGLTLLGIGLADTVRSLSFRSTTLICILIWVSTSVAAHLFAAVPWWLLPVPLAAGAAWAYAVPIAKAGQEQHRRLRSPLPVLAFATVPIACIAGALVSESLGHHGMVNEWSLGPIAGQTLVLGIGMAVFLVVSSNALVRMALQFDAQPGPVKQGELILEQPQLKGGRWIGPLERIALTGLLLAGAYPVAAGVIAAKGIIRFPEIQKDTASGSKAEYFLVGSLVSWTIALGAAGTLWLSAQ